MNLDDKFILDATAGFRMMWYDKKHPNTIYIDRRAECEPDHVCDNRKLEMFPDKKFRLIVFDPPHIIRKSPTENSNMIRDYGALRPETWKMELKESFEELWRVLDDYGVLMFKWSNQYIATDEVVALAPCKPLIYQISANHPKKKGSHVKTLWFCFMKIPK